MEIKDECGCVINRKYASDFLMKRVYVKNGKIKGDKVGEFKLDNNRWFRLYKGTDGKLYYESSECPIVVITLEALCERYEENGGKLTKEDAIEKLREVKGLTVNDLVKNVVDKLTGCMS